MTNWLKAARDMCEEIEWAIYDDKVLSLPTTLNYALFSKLPLKAGSTEDVADFARKVEWLHHATQFFLKAVGKLEEMQK